MDCDDVILALAGEATLTGEENAGLQAHLATCAECRELAHAEKADPAWRWVARLPDDAFDDPDLLALPVVDPIVFVADEELASGGMGKITRARDRRLGREVAIKEMLEPDLRARFEREATITARLQHPAIVPIYEAGTWPNGSAFYTMRLVAGGTLAEAIDAAETPVSRLALLPHVVAVTEALAYAHSRHIIHRDLKPQNVLVGEFGETVVIDWGLAKELDRDIDPATSIHAGAAPELTLAGAVIGTPCFMPPEQARGAELDERADVFALGAILYNVLAGEPPYWDQPRATADQLLEAVLARPPTPIAEKAPEAPADLRAVVERAMARDPDARYPSAKQLAEELRRFQAGQLLVSREYRIRELLGRWIGRHKAAVAVGGVAALALAIVGVIAVVNVTHSRDAERGARVVAEHATAETERSIAGLLEEQGRSELIAGQRERALAYLAEAYRRGRDTPALRHLLAEATRDLDLLVATLPAPADSGGRALAFLPDNRLAVWIEGVDHDSKLELGTETFPLGDALTGQFSPDGRRLVTTMRDAPTRVWDVTTGKQLWQVDGEVDGVAFDLASDRVALFPGHAGAQIYELDTGAKLLAIDGRYKVTSVAFDASGGVLATIGDEGLCTFFAWDPQRKTWTTVPFGKTGFELLDAGFLAERTDDRLVMTTRSREVLLWTLDAPFHAIGGHRAAITAIGVATKRRVFATADSSGEVKLWGYTGALLGETSDAHQAMRSLVFSHDAAMLAGIGDDPHVFVWNSALGLRGTLLAPGDEFEAVRAIAIAPDDSRIATVDDTGDHIRVWKPPHANLVSHHPASQVAVADHVVVVVAENQLVVLDAATGDVIRQLVLATPAVPSSGAIGDVDRPHLLVTEDGARALVVTADGASLYDLHAATLIRALRRAAANHPDSTIWELSASGQRVVELGDQRVRIHEPVADKLVLDVDAADQRGGALAPDESRLIQAGSKPRAWAVPGGAPIAMPELAIAKQTVTTKRGRAVEQWTEPNDLVFSPDGTRAVVLGTSMPLVIDAVTGALVAKLALTQLGDSVQTAKLDAAGHRVVTQVGQLAAVWNADTGALVFQIGNTAAGAIAITVEGSRIATGSDDGTVRIWDATGRLLEQLHGHRGKVGGLAFTRDGTRLVAHGADDEITVWDVHLEQRSPSEIAAIAAKATPWQVRGGQLVLAPSL